MNQQGFLTKCSIKHVPLFTIQHLQTSQTIKDSIFSNTPFCSLSSSLYIWLIHSLRLCWALNLWGQAELRWGQIRTKNPPICPSMSLPLHASSSLIFSYFTCSTFSLPWCALHLCNYKHCGAPRSHPFACSCLFNTKASLSSCILCCAPTGKITVLKTGSRILSRCFKEFHCRLYHNGNTCYISHRAICSDKRYSRHSFKLFC